MGDSPKTKPRSIKDLEDEEREATRLAALPQAINCSLAPLSHQEA